MSIFITLSALVGWLGPEGAGDMLRRYGQICSVDMDRYAPGIWTGDMHRGYAPEICTGDMDRIKHGSLFSLAVHYLDFYSLLENIFRHVLEFATQRKISQNHP